LFCNIKHFNKKNKNEKNFARSTGGGGGLGKEKERKGSFPNYIRFYTDSCCSAFTAELS